MSIDMKDWILLSDTRASISPLITHGKALRGPISTLNRAMLVNT